MANHCCIQALKTAWYYGIDSLGNVWSRVDKRKPGSTRSKKPRIKPWKQLKPCVHGDGYLYVVLVIDGVRKNRDIAHLVLENFVCPRPNGMEACHRDGNKRNNNLDNLRWDTPSGNAQDKVACGTHSRGSRSGVAKLTESDIPRILALRSKGMTNMAIGQELGVSDGTIRRIVVGKGWTHVQR